MAAGAILSVATNLISGVIKNKQTQNENAATAIETLSEEVYQAEKEAKTWQTVFIVSIVVALVLIVVLFLTRNRR